MRPANRYLLIILALPFMLLFAADASAQFTWRWGRIASSVSESYPVTTDNKGNVYAAGINSTTSAAVFDSVSVPASDVQSVWVKYSPTGQPLWAGGTMGGSTNLYNMTTDTGGNLIVYGLILSDTVRIGSITLHNSFYLTGGMQYFIAKINPAGTVLWAIKDGEPYYDFADDFYTGMLRLGDVATDDSANIYITSTYRNASVTIGGNTLTNTNSAGTTTDIFVAKYTPSGTLVWARSAGGTGNDHAFGITVAPSGNVFIAGAFRSTTFNFGSSVLSNPYVNPRAYIAEFSPAGTPLWAQAAGGSRGAYSVGIRHDIYGNIYMAGSFADTSITFGSETLTRAYPIAVPAYAAFLIKYSPVSLPVWSRCISSAAASVAAFSVATSPCGSVWVTGTSSHNVLLATGNIMYIDASGSDLPVYLVGYDFSGNVIGNNSLIVGGDDECDIACDAVGNAFLGGDFEGTLVTGPDFFIGSPSPSEHFFVAEYGFQPDTVFTHQNGKICASGSITIAAPAGQAFYLWDDGETSQDRSISGPGDYVVYATSCGDTVIADTFHIVIGPDTLVTIHDTAFCMYSDLVPLISLIPGFGTDYLWSGGDTTMTDSINAPGTYWVTYKNGCIHAFDTFFVTANHPPAPISGSGFMCLGDTSLFADADAGGVWSSSASSIVTIGSATGQGIGATVGTANITYIAPTGCYTSKTVTVNAPPCYNGVAQILPENQVSVTPNPAFDQFVLQSPKGVYTYMEILNDLGQVLLKQQVSGTQLTVNINTLPPGTYSVRLTGQYDTRVIRLVKI